jgi:CRISPR-associated protein Cmr2
MNRYIGITIGPIIDTLSLAVKPAQLWGASYIFSYTMKSICKKLPESALITPYPYDDTNKETIKDEKCGVGLFHDRIIIRADGIDLSGVSKIIEDTKTELATKINNELAAPDLTAAAVTEFVNDYIQLYAVEVETNENPIIEVSKCLDKIELMKSFSQVESRDDKNNQNVNYIIDSFSNKAIKTGFLINDASGGFENSVLSGGTDNGGIKQIKDVAGYGKASNGLKKFVYYAVVQADGDNMSKVNQKTYIDNGVDGLRDVSQKCFKYGARAVEIIKSGGGLPIYAGGDDLLFIAPVDNLFKLCDSISNEFNMIFKAEIEGASEYKPSVSFGISVNYEKSPLYEALEEARIQLFDVAKKVNGKDAIAVSLRKNSGIRFGFVFKKSSASYKLLNELIEKHVEKKDDFLKSVMYKIMENKELFIRAVEFCATDNFADNLLNDGLFKRDKVVEDYISSIKALIKSVISYRDIYGLPSDVDVRDTVEAVLRYVKFLVEKGDED